MFGLLSRIFRIWFLLGGFNRFCTVIMEKFSFYHKILMHIISVLMNSVPLSTFYMIFIYVERRCIQEMVYCVTTIRLLACCQLVWYLYGFNKEELNFMKILVSSLFVHFLFKIMKVFPINFVYDIDRFVQT